MARLLCGEGPFEIFLKEGAKSDHVPSVMVESTKNGKVVKVETGQVHIEGTGIHFALPGLVHFGFPFSDVIKIIKPNFKQPVWQNRVAK